MKTDSMRLRIAHLERLNSFPPNPDTGWIVNKNDTLFIYKLNHTWDTIGPHKGSGGGSTYFNGNRLVTRAGVAQVNAGGYTVTDFLNNYFFPSTYPTATLSGGTQVEYMASGANLTASLSYTDTRPTSCATISSIVVGGVTETLDVPFNEGHTQSGSQSVSYARNTTTTFTNTITTSDSKTGSASTSFTFGWKYYWGKIASNASPSDATIQALDGAGGAGVGTGAIITTTRVKNFNGINGAGQYLIFAFPSSWGTPTFVVNGLTSTAFTMVRNNTFFNLSGGSTSYQVWISNDLMNSPITQFDIE